MSGSLQQTATDLLAPLRMQVAEQLTRNEANFRVGRVSVPFAFAERLVTLLDAVATQEPALDLHTLEEAAAYIEGKGGVIPGAAVFASLVSGNNQPCMSGDPRDRLHPPIRRRFDDATRALATAIRALAQKGEAHG